jgi:hypothetical protein
MGSYWALAPHMGAEIDLPLTQVTGLLRKLGLSGRHAVAEQLLRLVGSRVPLAQCAIFSYEGGGRPRIVAIGDRARTAALPAISQDYVTRFYPMDGSVQVMAAESLAARRAGAANPHILLHRQTANDIAHPQYRAICYELPQVAERLAILALYQGERWMSVNFYRGVEHGPFDDAAIAVIEAFAPLLVQAVRLHHAGQTLNDDLAELMLARLRARCPALTKRDLDVVRGLLAGLATEGIAERMGIEVSSAQTYLYYRYQVHAPWLASAHPPQDRQESRDRRRRPDRPGAGAGPGAPRRALRAARIRAAGVEGSRAIVFTRRSMEILQQVGVADRHHGCGPALALRQFQFYRGQRGVPHGGAARRRRPLPGPMINLQQQCLEEYLLERRRSHR